MYSILYENILYIIELLLSFRVAIANLESFSADENAMRRDRVESEKHIAMMKHEMKEVQNQLHG